MWPLLLHIESPREFVTWFCINNFVRYFGFAHLGADTEPRCYTRTLPWFTLPAGSLALFALSRARLLDATERGGVQLTAVAALALPSFFARGRSSGKARGGLRATSASASFACPACA